MAVARAGDSSISKATIDRWTAIPIAIDRISAPLRDETSYEAGYVVSNCRQYKAQIFRK